MSSTPTQEELFSSLPVPVALRRMILPAAISQIIVLIYNMADTFYIGRTDNPYMLAGASLILPVFNMLLCLASLAGIGGGTLISRLLGAGQPQEARKVSTFSFYLAILLSLAFSVGLGVFMDQTLRFLGATDSFLLYARQYSFCVIVLGVGIATLLSNCVACLYFLGIFYRIRRTSVLTPNPTVGLPQAGNMAAVFGVGIPSAVASLLFDLDYVVIDKLMVAYSEVALAAIGIVLKVERLPLNVGIGICQGMVPLVAYNCAAGNEKRMNRVIRLSLGTGLAVAAASILLYEAFTPWIVRVFISDSATVQLADTFLRIRILATPLMFLSFFTVYIFQGFGNGRISLFLGVMRWAVFNIPMLFLLNHLVGMYGIVWSQITADVLTVALSAWVYYTRRPRFDGEGHILSRV